ncbi:endonuclease domain-containing protein [Spongisporangium articulatum]|uniref:Endonuclease domain-containing protein n=1 Tax=Spongisporangium articulatum TaxID=3362603 RepID=A0ABW8APU9_9ACTN
MSQGDLTHGRMIEAWRLTLPQRAVLSGVSAAWALGARFAWPDDPVEVSLPPHLRITSRPGLRVRGVELGGDDVVESSFGLCTSALRTACDLGRTGPLPLAVARLDAVAAATRLTASGLTRAANALPAGRGTRQLARAVRLVDPRAESIRESMLRVALVLAGLPPPVVQHEVRDPRGGFVARVDLAWPQWRLAVEYDGAYHDDRRQFSRDRDRLNRLREAGWEVLSFDATALRDLDRVVALVRAVLARLSS